MKNLINWPEILRKNEDAITEALQQAYENACGAQAGSGMKESVVVYTDGAVSQFTEMPNSMAGSVWDGEAIYAGHIDWFSPWSDCDDTEVITSYLSEEELAAFTAWLKENEYAECINMRELEEYNEVIAKRVYDEYIQDFIGENAQFWAKECFEQTLEDEEYQYNEKLAEYESLGKC